MKEMKNVRERLFDYSVKQCSPVCDEYETIWEYDADGNEIAKVQKVDTYAVIKSNGRVGDWSLQALVNAGIDPASVGNVHTLSGTRLEGLSQLNSVAAEIDAAIAAEQPQE